MLKYTCRVHSIHICIVRPVPSQVKPNPGNKSGVAAEMARALLVPLLLSVPGQGMERETKLRILDTLFGDRQDKEAKVLAGGININFHGVSYPGYPAAVPRAAGQGEAGVVEVPSGVAQPYALPLPGEADQGILVR